MRGATQLISISRVILSAYFYNLMIFLHNFKGMCSFAGKISQHITSITHELSSWYCSSTGTFYESDTTI